MVVAAIMESLRSLALKAPKFEVDEREPIFFFKLPGDDGAHFGITGMDPLFWITSFAFLGLQSVTNVLSAIIMYHFILMQRGTLQSFIIGYGFIIPLLFYLPLVLVQIMDLRNMAFMALLAFSSPAILSFRCIQAMHNCLPPFAFDEKNPSLSRFILYNAASIQFKFNRKTKEVIPFTRAEAIEKILHFMRIFLETTLLYCLLLPFDYKPCPSRDVRCLVDLFFWGNVANNFLMAYLTGVAMESGAVGLGLLFSVTTGLSTMEFNDHPLTRSTSPSDFWGRRWDKIVQQELRRGVFDPLRKLGLNRSMSAVGTFLASGILHEYVLFASSFRGAGAPSDVQVFYNNPQQKPFTPNYGSHMIFFAWNGVVLLGEHLLTDTAPLQWMQNNLPRPLRTTLTLLTVLPISHLFTDEYIASCFYSDIVMGFPRIDVLSEGGSEDAWNWIDQMKDSYFDRIAELR